MEKINAQIPAESIMEALKVKHDPQHPLHEAFNHFVEYIAALHPGSLMHPGTVPQIEARYEDLERRFPEEAWRLFDSKFGSRTLINRLDSVIHDIIADYKGISLNRAAKGALRPSY